MKSRFVIQKSGSAQRDTPADAALMIPIVWYTIAKANAPVLREKEILEESTEFVRESVSNILKSPRRQPSVSLRIEHMGGMPERLHLIPLCESEVGEATRPDCLRYARIAKNHLRQ